MDGRQPNVCLRLIQMTGIQPNGWDSAIWLGLSNLAGTQPKDWDSDKWLGLSQKAGTQPIGLDSPKWLGLSQMAGTQPNGWDWAKWLGLTRMAGTQPNDCDLAKWLQLNQMATTQSNGWDSTKWLWLYQSIQYKKSTLETKNKIITDKQYKELFFNLKKLWFPPVKKLIVCQNVAKIWNKNLRVLAATFAWKSCISSHFLFCATLLRGFHL